MFICIAGRAGQRLATKSFEGVPKPPVFWPKIRFSKHNNHMKLHSTEVIDGVSSEAQNPDIRFKFP